MVSTEPALVTAFHEYFHRKADATGYKGMHRIRTRMEIRALIHELEGNI